METINLSQKQIDILNYLVYKELALDNKSVDRSELHDILRVLQKLSDSENDTEKDVYMDYLDPHPESIYYI